MSAIGRAIPPVARKEPKVETLHGRERVDEYHWLRRKDAPDVLAHLRDENAYTDATLAPLGPLRDQLYDEMLARIKEDDVSVPYRVGGDYYFSRTEKGRQYPVLCRKRGSLVGPEQVLLDLNEVGSASPYVALGSFEVSDDGQTLAYALDTTGFRQYLLAFKNLVSGDLHPERIPLVTSVAFSRDGKSALYAVEDETTKRPHRVFRHVLGSDPADDVLVYEECDERFVLHVERTRSRAFILITSASKTASEVRTLPADGVDGEPTLIEPRAPDHEYYLDHRGDCFLIRTNSGGRNFRLCEAPVATPWRSHWNEIVAHREDVMLEGVDAFATFTVLLEREDALPHLTIHDHRSGRRSRIALPEPAYDISPETNREFDTRLFRYGYQSPVTPRSIYDHDVDKGDSVLLKRTEILGGFDPAHYQVRREHAVASDGTRIPLSIVARKDCAPGTPHPLLLYGYGSYGYPFPVTFASTRLSLLDRGVVFVIAHVRGGGDMGKRWHDEGRMANKMNTFTDFIAAAEHLIEQRWTASDRLAIQGGSAGGLLVAATLNLRPDLVKAALLQVPFVDVVNTMLDESLPLTVGEFEEWGNPRNPADADVMLSYSPYDNLRPAAYPAMLVKTSYNDSQVMYWEPAKYVARLRAVKTDDNLVLLKINLEPAGHGGQSGRYNQLREVAFEYAFVLWQLGCTDVPA